MSLIKLNSIAARTGTLITIIDSLKFRSVPSGTSVNYLGIDVNGNVIGVPKPLTTTEVFVTGGTYTNGTARFTNITGGTFDVIGFYTGSTATEVFVTGGTYNTGVTTFTNNTGGTFNVTGYYTGSTATEVFVTGGTYTSGVATFANNTGGTFTVSGFYTGSTGGGEINISEALYTVNNNLNANNTTTATTSVCIYGVNVFTGVTSANYATKLPQPVTGKSVKVINNGSTLLSIYPSNIGGQINNLPVNTPAQIPPDGKPYEFICIVNPLPGAWTFSSPATAQFDSGEITITVTGGTNGGGNYTPVVSAFDANNVGFGQGTNTSTWGYNGKNTAAINNNGTTVAFRPQTPWLGISKIKVYTNIITANTGGDGDDTLVNLFGNCESDLYDITTNQIITNGASALNNTLFNFNLTNTIAGTNALTTKTSTNIGDAGTLWGEKIANTDSNSNVSFGAGFGTVIGQLDKGNILYPYGSGPYVGLQVNKFYTSFISFQMRPLAYTNYGTLTNLKFRFVIEYYQ